MAVEWLKLADKTFTGLQNARKCKWADPGSVSWPLSFKPSVAFGQWPKRSRVEKDNPHVFVCNVQISRADRLRLRVHGGAGHRRALARRQDDSGDGLQLRHRAGGVSR